MSRRIESAKSLCSRCFEVVIVLTALMMKLTRKKVLPSLLAGVAAMVLITIPANLIVTPIFMGVSRQVVLSMLPTVFIPFNLVKASINAAVTFLVWLPLKKANLN